MKIKLFEDIDIDNDFEWEEHEPVDFQKVKVYVMISGDYCAFHEMGIDVVYDITNDKKVGYGGDSLEKLKNWEGDGYSDVTIFDAIKIGNDYYVKL